MLDFSFTSCFLSHFNIQKCKYFINKCWYSFDIYFQAIIITSILGKNKAILDLFTIIRISIFIISTQISSKSISIIFIDILMATIRLMAMISIMTFYIIDAKSQNILIAIRSILFSSGLNIYWIDKFILFFEMTISFFQAFMKIGIKLKNHKKLYLLKGAVH